MKNKEWSVDQIIKDITNETFYLDIDYQNLETIAKLKELIILFETTFNINLKYSEVEIKFIFDSIHANWK